MANSELRIGRAAQDAFAAESHRRPSAPSDCGPFKCEITALTDVLEADEGIRPNTTEQKLGLLWPAFTTDRTITASQTSDAAAGIITSKAARVLLDRNGLGVNDIGLWGDQRGIRRCRPSLRRASSAWTPKSSTSTSTSTEAQERQAIRPAPARRSHPDADLCAEQPGLDHVAFACDLAAWEKQLNTLGILYGGIKLAPTARQVRSATPVASRWRSSPRWLGPPRRGRHYLSCAVVNRPRRSPYDGAPIPGREVSAVLGRTRRERSSESLPKGHRASEAAGIGDDVDGPIGGLEHGAAFVKSLFENPLRRGGAG